MATAEGRRDDRFRRRPFRQPHSRRRLAVRLLRPFLAAVVVVATPALVVAWVLSSERFALAAIDVRGTERVDAAWVLGRLEPLRGRHLLRFDLGDVQERLAGHDWIAGLAIRKQPPDRLEVRIEEREPAAVVEGAEGRYFADRGGERIAPFDGALSDRPLLLVTGTETPREVAAAVAIERRWRRARPEWAGDLVAAVATAESSFEVTVAGVPFPLVVRSDNLESALARFDRFLPEVVRRYPRVDRVDLRFDTQIVIHAAAAPRSRKG